MCKLRDYNITIFGDSIAKGIITTADGKIQRLEACAVNLLQQRWGKEITNNSAFGQTLERIYNKGYIEDYISNLDKTQNNCVVIAIGGNDSDFNWKTVASAPTKKHDSNTTIKQFGKHLDELVKKLKKVNVEVILVTLVPMDSKRFFDNVIGKQSDKSAVLSFLKNDLNNIYKYQERFSAEIVHCAIKNGCKIADLRAKLLESRNYSNLLCKDGIHPNKRGQKAIANFFIKSFA